MTELNLTHSLAATGVPGKALSGLELRLLELMVSGHPDRRATVIHRGEKFRCSPLSWQELMTGSLADDHAKAGAISSLVAVGACDTTRQPIGLLQRMKMKKSATFFYVTPRGHDLLIKLQSDSKR